MPLFSGEAGRAVPVEGRRTGCCGGLGAAGGREQASKLALRSSPNRRVPGTAMERSVRLMAAVGGRPEARGEGPCLVGLPGVA